MLGRTSKFFHIGFVYGLEFSNAGHMGRGIMNSCQTHGVSFILLRVTRDRMLNTLP